MRHLFEYLLVEAKNITERTNANGEKEVDCLVKWQQADQINGNGRLYPRPILEREIKKIQADIDIGETVYGHPFHPPDGVGTSDEISHEWKKVWLNEKGEALGQLTVLPTSRGKDIQILISGGRKLGISSRGFGKTVEKIEQKTGKKYQEVQDDFSLSVPGDWSLRPSVAGAGTCAEELRLCEDLMNKEEPIEETITVEQAEAMGLIASSKTKSQGAELTEEQLMEQMEAGYKEELNLHHFRGSFEQFRCRHEESFRIEFNMPDNPKLEELKNKIAEDESLQLLWQEYRRAGGRKSLMEFSKVEGQQLLEQKPSPTPEKPKELEPDYSNLVEKDIMAEAFICKMHPKKYLEKLRKR
jgi:hypothetical protein